MGSELLIHFTHIFVLVISLFRDKLSISERFKYALAPIDVTNEIQVFYFHCFVRAHAERRHVPLGIKIHQRKMVSYETDSALERLERLEAL